MACIKRSIIVSVLMLLLVGVFSGCESTVQVPKNELKNIADLRIHSEYSNAEYSFVGEKYDLKRQIYELSYNVKQPSLFGFTTEERLISMRFVYDPASKEWHESRLDCSNLRIIPNFTNIGHSFFAESSLGGTVSVQILSLDPVSSTVTVNIRENSLTVQAENHISRPTYVINRDEKNLICAYYTGVDEVIINLGESNGIQQKLLLRHEPFSNTPQFSLYTGNNSFEALNAILDLEKR